MSSAQNTVTFTGPEMLSRSDPMTCLRQLWTAEAYVPVFRHDPGRPRDRELRDLQSNSDRDDGSNPRYPTIAAGRLATGRVMPAE